MAKKIEVDAAKVEELRQQHQWHTVMALHHAFSITPAGIQTGALDWPMLCRAAYHAGAARSIRDVTF